MRILALLLPLATIILILAFLFSNTPKNDIFTSLYPQKQQSAPQLTKGNSDNELNQDLTQTDQDLNQITTDTGQFSQAINDSAQDNEANITE